MHGIKKPVPAALEKDAIKIPKTKKDKEDFTADVVEVLNGLNDRVTQVELKLYQIAERLGLDS